ncbi:ABC transporter substrate-binding protein [Vineibacter terrae]|uniref:ABC transporter substrate-binding protein n=1 Tax=Vineibacter terrae TaxID=2586908 RepID=A0A5C8PC82_9HYPH|nr:ABC transporter substrate-binding protein [Vineibacter terrae]TXL70867.1 ABC transporter substrate-binding protein [Vineibacter terrae]
MDIANWPTKRGLNQPSAGAVCRPGYRVIERREVISLLVGAVIARPLLASAQPATKVWRVGLLGEGLAPVRGTAHPAVDPLLEGLRERGYDEGRNLRLEARWAEGKIERLPVLAAELVGLRVDTLIAPGTREGLALQKATTTIPIVMLFPGDPVGVGLVTSLASPGGNITGMSLMYPDVSGKRLDLFREIIPTFRRIAILGNLQNAASAADIRATEAAASTLGFQFYTVSVESADHLADGLSEIAKNKPDGLIAIQDTVILSNRGQIAEFAVQNRLASVFPGRAYVASGGLIGYGPNLRQIARRATVYVDKILKGAKPADLPVEQPTAFELIVNLRVARALGITIPFAVLARADEVIE